MINRMSNPKDTIKEEFIKFATIGLVGFVVDISVLYFGLYIIGLGYFVARIFSYLAAATTTWYLHRVITFVKSKKSNPLKQWISFIFANGLGGAVNFTTYILIIIYITNIPFLPLMATTLGAVNSLILNFYISRKWVFNI